MSTTTPIQWHTEKHRVKDLIPFEYNPRILTEEKKQLLKNSLEKFNLAEIPAINTDKKIIAGHQRIKVLMELGRADEVIEVRVPNRPLTETEFKEYNITSNVPTGYWDIDVLEEMFSDIDLMALGLDIDSIEIPEALLPEDLREEEEADYDDTLPVDPITVEGDVYELRSPRKNIAHRIVCGSSCEADTVRKLLHTEKIDLTVTDPPYNVDYQGGAENKREGIKNDSMSSDAFYEFLLEFYKNAFHFSAPGAPIYVFHADSEGLNFRRAFADSGFKLSQCLIWKKNSIVMGRQDYHWIHEPCLYGWKEGAAHPWYSDRKQTTVLEFDRPIKSEEHPTMKPVELLVYLIANSSRKKAIVFDAFLGSGSTLIACEQTWRQCRGIELDPKYVDVEVRRWVTYCKENNLEYHVFKNGEMLTAEALNQYFDDEGH